MASPILVTGAAGFIGMHVARRLLADGREVVGLDILSAYYDPRLKAARLAELERFQSFVSRRSILPSAPPSPLCLRANASLCRASRGASRRAPLVVNPLCLRGCQLAGFLNLLEACRTMAVPPSSLCVVLFGLWRQYARAVFHLRQCRPSAEPLCRDQEGQRTHGACLCASFALPATGLRFFTAYGPWGRPDMAMWIFTEAIMAGRPSSCSTGDRCCATLPMSTTWWKRWCGWSPCRRRPMLAGRATRRTRPAAARPGGSKTSATARRSSSPRPVELIEQSGRQVRGAGACAQQPGDVAATLAPIPRTLERAVGFRPRNPDRRGHWPICRVVSQFCPALNRRQSHW